MDCVLTSPHLPVWRVRGEAGREQGVVEVVGVRMPLELGWPRVASDMGMKL